MNAVRIRLVLGTAVLSTCLTVLVLKLAGYLEQPSAGPTLRLMSSQPSQLSLSPWRIDCGGHIARVSTGDSDGRPAFWLSDNTGSVVSCQPVPAP